MNNELLMDSTLVWERLCEAASLGYDTEIAEYAERCPRPTLKMLLKANAGMNQDPDRR